MKVFSISALLLATVLMGGCASPPTFMVTNGLILQSGVQKAQFVRQVQDQYSDYQKDHAASPCLFGEDTIMPGLIQYIKRRGEPGVEESIRRLQKIADDKTLSAQVRSHALYTIAVLYLRREPQKRDPEKALQIFEEIYTEYPGTHDCLIEDTPWRRRMEKKLGIVVPESLNRLIKPAAITPKQ
jgi:hypothetical protein